MNKSYRQGQILKVIGRKRIHTQEELARELAGLGLQATQVTLSRDIKDLGLAKTGDGYVQIGAGAPAAGPDLGTVIAEFLTDVRAAQNQVVLKTSPGNANALAVALDRENWPEVVGTIAGDDTVLVIAPDSSTAGKLRTKLLKFTV
ncbi:MAG: ArgR family transcriptional regulator [Acidimicrobiia bacterium]|nr:ArgR family transcriptional regulator [Acidimicrobiia bacterium]